MSKELPVYTDQDVITVTDCLSYYTSGRTDHPNHDLVMLIAKQQLSLSAMIAQHMKLNKKLAKVQK